MKRACLALLLAGLALKAQAVGHLADVEVIDRTTGNTLEAHYYRGDIWVAGTPGGRYSILIRNRLGERLLAVTSVDGVNVVSGETAGWQQTGYVFGPYQGYEISGWRKSDHDVATFEFTAVPNSYAARTGRSAQVGIIGVALFRERPAQPAVPAIASAGHPEPPAAAPTASAREANAAAGASAKSDMVASDSIGRVAPVPAPVPGLGTGHGARETSYVEHTDFERLTAQPNEVIRIRYDSLDNLVAMGVVRPRPVLPPRPNPFPESPAPGYVPDPPGGALGGLR